MRILLQQRETGLYFKDINCWTLDCLEAMDFLSSTAAIEFCAMNKLDTVQIVLKFEEEKFNIVLPMHSRERRWGNRASGTAS